MQRGAGGVVPGGVTVPGTPRGNLKNRVFVVHGVGQGKINDFLNQIYCWREIYKEMVALHADLSTYNLVLFRW